MLTYKLFLEELSGGATTTGSVAGIGRDIEGRPNQGEPPKKGPSTLIRRKKINQLETNGQGRRTKN